jgi:hypothetical protein
MNVPPPLQPVEAVSSEAARMSVPIDLVVLAVRIAEFLTVLIAGGIAVWLWADRIPAADVQAYSRAILAAAWSSRCSPR